MGSYILKRILATIPVIGIVALIVFSLLFLTPGDPAAVMAGDQATPEQIASIRQSLGLDQPFVPRFLTWAGNVLSGDLGSSVFTRQPVTTMIGQRIEPTLSLMVLTIGFAVLVAVPIGVVAAYRQNSLLDNVIMAGAVLGFSVPVFVLGYLLAWILAQKLQLLPVQGYRPIAEGVWPWLRHMILPVLSVSGVYIALIARITRTTMLEVLNQDYIRTARAKGAGELAVLFLHALRNGSVQIVTVIGLGVALLIGGAVVTESVFSLPGLGRLTVDAILQRDYPVIQGVILLFSLVYVLVNLLVDLSYVLLDPRIRY
ncbi:ABC transporter permease [Stappia sp.]|uniref:ABC transporter permease n=1 Tax=Stappia sp. TaxID=1870903 RepID=UPI003A9932B9